MAYSPGAGEPGSALYHHFKGKDALFEAVLEALETDVGRRTVAASAGAPSATAALRAGCLAWVRIAGDPVVQRILLIDAPSVLGWDRWRALEERHALGLIKAALAMIASEGGLAPGLVEIFSHVLLATMNEIALFVARADDPGTAMSSATDAVEEVLSRLVGDPR